MIVVMVMMLMVTDLYLLVPLPPNECWDCRCVLSIATNQSHFKTWYEAMLGRIEHFSFCDTGDQA